MSPSPTDRSATSSSSSSGSSTKPPSSKRSASKRGGTKRGGTKSNSSTGASLPKRPANARVVAARVLQQTLLHGARLDQQLEQIPHLEDPRDRALVHELCTGVTRWYLRLDGIAGRLFTKPLKDPELKVPVLLGLYQLCYTRIPVHAAVSTSVETAVALGFRSARGLVNGVLRRFTREREQIEQSLATDAVAQHAHPSWFIDAVTAAWPDEVSQILSEGNCKAPLTLRCNLKHGTRDAYLARLAAANIAATAHPASDAGINVTNGGDPRQLPGFGDGHVSVQDGAAQLVAASLDPPPSALVLDACAAPGGKTAAMLERNPGLAVTALDVDRARIDTTREGLERLGLTATLKVGDACTPSAWHNGAQFSHILIDAPCTATGIIRRHPDIKLRRAEGDDAKLALIQGAMLAALWPLLAPGGTLLYATCSILPTENSAVVNAFLSAHADAELEPLSLPFGRDTGAGMQLLPGDGDMDGFFYAKIGKR